MSGAFWRSSSELRDALCRGARWDEVAMLLTDLLMKCGGPFGRSLRRGYSSASTSRAPGLSEPRVFPVPLLSTRLPHKGRGRLRAKQRVGAVHLANLLLVMLSMLNTGGECMLLFWGLQVPPSDDAGPLSWIAFWDSFAGRLTLAPAGSRKFEKRFARLITMPVVGRLRLFRSG